MNKKNRLSLSMILLIEVLMLTILFVYSAMDKDKTAIDAGLSGDLPEEGDASDMGDAENIRDMEDTGDTAGIQDTMDTGEASDTGSSVGDKLENPVASETLPGHDTEADYDEVEYDTKTPQTDSNEPTSDSQEAISGQTHPQGEGDEGSIPGDVYDTITISAAGDVTLGRDKNYGYERSFDHELEMQENDFSYFFKNVRHIFEADDLTIVNLETTLTKADKPAEKKFRFRADPSYVEILRLGDIEAVSIANNHTLDYLQKGYEETLSTLKEAAVGYFGYEHSYITEIRGIKIGILGYKSWNVSNSLKQTISDGIDGLKDEGADIVIIMFHWGTEGNHYFNSVQKEMAHFSIDEGADLVLGSHPHVLQGIEEYNDKSIVYSLGNFCFGGNKNPKDKDSMIYIHSFNFKNGELLSQESEVIPCSISSVKERNNYQPTPFEGSEGERVLNKIEKYSKY